jgi:hypothetical protein
VGYFSAGCGRYELAWTKRDEEQAMLDQTNPDDPRRKRLDEVIGSFLVAVDDGQNADPREWLARHPELCP